MLVAYNDWNKIFPRINWRHLEDWPFQPTKGKFFPSIHDCMDIIHADVRGENARACSKNILYSSFRKGGRDGPRNTRRFPREPRTPGSFSVQGIRERGKFKGLREFRATNVYNILAKRFVPSALCQRGILTNLAVCADSISGYCMSAWNESETTKKKIYIKKLVKLTFTQRLLFKQAKIKKQLNEAGVLSSSVHAKLSVIKSLNLWSNYFYFYDYHNTGKG